ncbi:cytochrome P450 family protein [Actinomadura rudentiformis]|uniref:P450-derived glycosyltransferase activator n=1 Tax=Actinomadura rudentiformis TaxID=359158 RepID=A0A6H9YJ92_9ACTN|nr:P450-derived glycosyltransferase activator [Actinomadura rudentiformis]KAB2346155.1 P450-derived glycosyltransferase activator [Actinomadura rudentiformis]
MTKHQIDPRLCTESDLARHLLAARGTQWMRGNRGDAYALILRDQGVEPRRLFPGMRGRPALRQSQSDVWVTACHAAGTEILADPALALAEKARTTRSRRAGGRGGTRQRIFGIEATATLKHVLTVDDSLLAMDGPGYTGLPQPTFHDPVAVFSRVLGEAGDGFDLMTDFARPATVDALADAYALPAEIRAGALPLCAEASGLLDALLCPPTLGMTQRMIKAFDGLRSLLEHEDGDEFKARTIAFTVGVDITANLICGAVLALLDHPAQWRALHEDVSLAADAVEETLRHVPPVRLESRIATRDLTVAGQPVEAGDQLVVLVDAANHDPDVFHDPDTFDITRERKPHLSLAGHSPAAFAAPAARRLAAAALEALSGTDLRRDGETVRRMRSPVTQALTRVPVSR